MHATDIAAYTTEDGEILCAEQQNHPAAGATEHR